MGRKSLRFFWKRVLSLAAGHQESLVACAFLLAAVGVSTGSLLSFAIDQDSFEAFTSPVTRDWTLLGRLFSRQYYSFTSRSYEPIAIFSHFIVYSIFDPNPVGFRCLNVFLLWANSLFVWQIGKEMSLRRRWALVAGILYITHPIHAANWSAAPVPHAWMTFFGLLAFWSHARARKANFAFSWIAIVAVFYVLSLLSKESGIMVPFLLLASDLFYWKNQKRNKAAKKRHLGEYVILFLMAIVYLFFLKEISRDAWARPLELKSIRIQPFAAWLPRLFSASGLLVSGWRAVILYPFLGLIGFSGLKLPWGKTGFFILASLLALLPALNLVYVGNYSDYLALSGGLRGRYLLLPAAFFCLLIGAVMDAASRNIRWGRLLCIAAACLTAANVLAAYAAVPGNRRPFDDFKAYFQEGAPADGGRRSGVQLLRLAWTLPFIERKAPEEYERIKRMFEKHLPKKNGGAFFRFFVESDLYGDPVRLRFLKRLGRERREYGVDYLMERMRRYSRFEESFGEGRASFNAGDYGKSIASLSRAIGAWPGYGEAYLYRACAHLENGRASKAMADFRQAASAGIEKNTDLQGCRGILLDRSEKIREASDRGIVLYLKGDYENALGAFDRALIFFPDNPETLVSHGACYAAMGKPALAVRDYDLALRFIEDNEGFMAASMRPVLLSARATAQDR